MSTIFVIRGISGVIVLLEEALADLRSMPLTPDVEANIGLADALLCEARASTNLGDFLERMNPIQSFILIAKSDDDKPKRQMGFIYTTEQMPDEEPPTRKGHMGFAPPPDNG